jgi:hypothetical protein
MDLGEIVDDCINGRFAGTAFDDFGGDGVTKAHLFLLRRTSASDVLLSAPRREELSMNRREFITQGANSPRPAGWSVMVLRLLLVRK